MRVIISAGGTGGHIYPALAIIDKIKEKEPNSEFLYIGTHNRMEKDIVPKKGIPYKSIEIYGFNRKHLLKNFNVLKCLIKAKKDVRKIIKDFNPDVVIGVGGYVTYPVITEAKKMGYKTFIHEQNSIPGKANAYMEKYADIIGVSFESSKKYFKTNKVEFTGNPCSENSLKEKAASKKEFGLADNKKLVLFVMGSLGSSKVNDYLFKLVPKFKDKDYEVVIVTGYNLYTDIDLKNIPKNVFVFPYIDNLVRLMKKTDVIVSRAGASTLSELTTLNLPSILVPSPYVANNHQYINAMDFKENGACLVIEEKDLNDELVLKDIDLLLNDEEVREKMKKSLEKLSVKDSATKIYNLLKELVGR